MIKKTNLTWYIFFGLGIFVILFHLLRNVSPAYFLIVLLSLTFFLISSLSGKKSKKIFIIYAVFTAVFFYILILSLISSYDENPLLGMFRLFYMLPLIFYFFNRNFNNEEALFFWKILLVFSILSTFSILIQYIIGPISWFATYSERADTERFSSLVGSLTSYGGFISVPILTSMFIIKTNTIRITLIMLLIFGAALSLQKMSIASVTLSFLLLAYFQKTLSLSKLIMKTFYSTLLTIIFGFVLYYLLKNQFAHHLDYFLSIFDSDTQSVGDVSVTQSIEDRFLELPLLVIEKWGVLKIFFGIGVYGGAGGLGYPYLPMAHNLLFEITFIFGIPLGVTIIVYFFSTLIRFSRIAKKSNNTRLTLAVSVFGALLLTNIFSGGLLYHPVIGLAFWFSLSEIVRYKSYVIR